MNKHFSDNLSAKLAVAGIWVTNFCIVIATLFSLFLVTAAFWVLWLPAGNIWCYHLYYFVVDGQFCIPKVYAVLTDGFLGLAQIHASLVN